MRGIEFVDNEDFNFKTLEFDDPYKGKNTVLKVEPTEKIVGIYGECYNNC